MQGATKRITGIPVGLLGQAHRVPVPGSQNNRRHSMPPGTDQVQEERRPRRYRLTPDDSITPRVRGCLQRSFVRIVQIASAASPSHDEDVNGGVGIPVSGSSTLWGVALTMEGREPMAVASMLTSHHGPLRRAAGYGGTCWSTAYAPGDALSGGAEFGAGEQRKSGL